ncbi:Uncharacterised protein [Serratia ficaria]|nr:Uncharacterised protein [Serratia ficaria]
MKHVLYLLSILMTMGLPTTVQAPVRVKVVVASVDSCGPLFPLRI